MKRHYNKKMKFSKQILVSLIAVCVVVPNILSAGLESEFYTIDTYSVGAQGSPMQSSNYQLTQGHMMPVVPVEPEVPPNVPEEPTEIVSDSNTQSGTKIVRFADEQDVILETQVEQRVFDSMIPLEIQKMRGVILPPSMSEVDRGDENRESEESVGDSPKDANDSQGVPEGRELAASLIMSDAGGAGSQLDSWYQRVFGEMYVRALFAFGVLMILIYIRSRTNIGRKYKPF